MDRPLPVPLAALWALVATAGLVVVTNLTVALRPGAASDIVSLGGCEALVFVLGSFGVLTLHQPDRVARAALGLRATHPALALFGLGLGLALQVPAESLRALVEQVAPTSDQEIMDRALLLATDSPGKALKLMVVAAIVVPLVEEVFFRGALFGSLRRSNGALASAAVTTVAFTLTHLDPKVWLPLLPVAMALGHLRVASGSLLPCLALHVGFNAVTVLTLVTGASTVTRPLVLGAPVVAAGWLMAAALLFSVQWVAATSDEAAAARAEDGA